MPRRRRFIPACARTMKRVREGLKTSRQWSVVSDQKFDHWFMIGG
jgi:hypothetical protein